jgi:hypothetical protein
VLVGLVDEIARVRITGERLDAVVPTRYTP